MRVISLLNFKGGVGKTTSTHSIASGLNLKGKKVLVIDMDPQGTLTFFSKGDKELKGDKLVAFVGGITDRGFYGNKLRID